MDLIQKIIPIDKPTGITSYDVIRNVKKILPKGTKIGHGGTLDPFAEGVLLLLLGKATKRFDEVRSWKKTYLATAKLGATSDTLDREGKIGKQEILNREQFSEEKIQQIADKYVGEIEQEVPAYAAAKYKGRKLYEYAREGKKIPKKVKQVTVYSLKVVSVNEGEVKLRVECGSGTYIRQLSYDILKELGVESYLEKLVRERVGEYGLEDCRTIEQVLDEGVGEQW